MKQTPEALEREYRLCADEHEALRKALLASVKVRKVLRRAHLNPGQEG